MAAVASVTFRAVAVKRVAKKAQAARATVCMAAPKNFGAAVGAAALAGLLFVQSAQAGDIALGKTVFDGNCGEALGMYRRARPRNPLSLGRPPHPPSPVRLGAGGSADTSLRGGIVAGNRADTRR